MFNIKMLIYTTVIYSYIILVLGFSMNEKHPEMQEIHKSKEKCTFSVKINMCAEKVNKRYTFYNGEEEIIFCPNKPEDIKSIDWFLLTQKKKLVTEFTKSKNKQILTLPAQSIKKGEYYLKAKVKLINGATKTALCSMDYMAEPPIIEFMQTKSQTVVYNSTFSVNLVRKALESYDDSPRVWSPDCIMKDKVKCFCPRPIKEESFSLKYETCVYNYIVEASVMYGNQKLTNRHFVFGVPYEKIITKLRCISNCGEHMGGVGVVDIKQPVEVELQCYDKCEDLRTDKITWKVNHLRGIELKRSLFKVSKSKLGITMLPGSLSYNKAYQIMIYYPGLFKNFIAIETERKFIPPRCKITPLQGIGLVTHFKFTCTLEPYFNNRPPLFNVYQSTGEESFTLLKTSSLAEFTLLLTASKHKQKFKIILTTQRKVEFECWTNEVIVNEDTGTKDEQMTKMIKSMDKMFIYGDTSKAVQYGKEVLHLLPNLSEPIPDDKLNSIYTRTLYQLNKIMLYDSTHYRSVADELPIIYSNNSLIYSNTSLVGNTRSALSELCNTLSEVHLDKSTSKMNGMNTDDIKRYSKYLEKCGSILLENKREEENNMTTEEVLVKEPVFTEDYKDYDEFNINAQIEREQINSINTISKAAQSTAAILNISEEYRFSEDNSETLVTKEKSSVLVLKQYNSGGISVKPLDITTNQEAVTLVFTALKNEAIKSRRSSISTNIADVSFFGAKNFKEKVIHAKFALLFKVLNDNHEINEGKVTVPDRYDDWGVPEINYNMNVHKINLKQNYHCVAQFSGLAVGVKIMVAVTINRRPNLQDFEKSYTVAYNNNRSQVINYPFSRTVYDTYVYTAILPHPESLTNSSGKITVKYRVEFTQQVCLYYDIEAKEWTTADCEVKAVFKTLAGKVSCVCSHSSIFSAKVETASNKLDVVSKFAFMTSDPANYIIFIHVCVVFICFCFALLFSNSRRKTVWGRDKVFFLSDNLKNDLYAYLLIVKTGTLPFSGTTSNIILRIKGKVNSRPHVLNYPDPDKLLLKRNTTDWFILTNDLYLGNINSIELWLDNIGMRPPWFCEYISIIDIQTKVEYYFNVQRWLTVASDNGDFAEIYASQRKGKYSDFVKRFTSNVRFYYGADHTWNIFLKKEDNKLLYTQRITIILSMILTTYVFTIICLDPPSLVSNEAYSYGRFRFYAELVPVIIGISFMSSIINLPFVFIFRNSATTKIEHSYIYHKRMFTVTHMKIAWFILSGWIGVCFMFLIIFGFFVTLYTSYLWMVCSISSIMFSICVIENIYIIIIKMMSSYFKKVNKKIYNFNGILKEVEIQRRALFKKFGETLLRPYFKSHYRRLTRTTIMDMRDRQKVRLDVIDLFGDMCLFIIYLILLYTIILNSANQYLYLSNRNMNIMLSGKIRRDHFPLENIQNMSEYINQTIIPTIHAKNWYGKWFMDDSGSMIDFKTKILGIVQLRQQRTNSSDQYDRKFPHSNGSGISISLGEVNYYGGEGYIVHLGRTLKNSMFVLNKLINNNWIDNETNVVFIEFWTYNAYANMFNAVRIIIEKLPSEDIGRVIDVTSRELIYKTKLGEGIVLVLFILFLGTIFVMTAKRIILMINARKLYFKSVWNVTDLVILFLSTAIVTLFFIRDKMVSTLLDDLAKLNHNEFVNYFHLFMTLNINEVLTALLVSTATIRMWKYFEFGRAFHVIGRSLKIAATGLFVVLIYQTYIFLTFSVYLYSMHCAQFRAFRSFWTTITTVFLSSVNFYKELNKKEFVTAGALIYVYWTFFMICSVTFYSFYCTILMMAFQQCKIYFSNRGRHYTLKNFLSEEGTYNWNLIKRQRHNVRLKGGDDRLLKKKYVLPKEPAQRYADSVFMNKKKVSIMKLVSIILIRKLRRSLNEPLDEQDHLLMAQYLILTTQSDSKHFENEVFFKGFDKKKIKFVSDIKIRQIAFITEKLLCHEEIEAMENLPLLRITGDEDRFKFIQNSLELLLQIIENIKIK